MCIFINENKACTMHSKWLIAVYVLLFSLCGNALAADDDLLDPEKAFAVSVAVAADGQSLAVKWDIAKDYHLYGDSLRVTSASPGVILGEASRKKGPIIFDKGLKKMTEVLTVSTVMDIPLISAPKNFEIEVGNQGCSDAGVCYFPMTQTFQIALPAAVAKQGAQNGASKAADTSATNKTAGAIETPDEESRVANALGSGSLVKVVMLFALLGLLLAFTPCVLPMVPILSSIIIGQKGEMTRGRGFALSASYSLGMAVVYTSLGVAAGLAGEGLAAALQTPAVLMTFSALLALLALSMFDVYQLQMPAFIQERLNSTSNRLTSGSFISIFVMGALSALVVGPCVAAPLAGALVYISKSRDVVTGGVALFSMAVGMSVPLLLTGLSAGSLLPRVGKWMEGVKYFFGFMLLGVALWMVEPVLPEWLQMLAWGVMLLVIAAFMEIFEGVQAHHTAHKHPAKHLKKGFALAILFLGIAEIAGVTIGNGTLLRPLKGLSISKSAEASENNLVFSPVTNLEQLESAIKNSAKPVMLDFYADWCTSCKEMEAITFPDQQVKQKLAGYTLLRADVTSNSASSKALLKKFGLFGPPAIIVLDQAGNELPSARMIGFLGPDAFLNKLAAVQISN